MNTVPENKKHEKIFFRLKKDEDGYPPDDWETLWAFEVEPELYSLDNIPFFAYGVSYGDVVSVKNKNGELHFKKVVRPSGHSVLRVIVYDSSDAKEVHEKLSAMNCDTEQSHLPSLITVDVPPSVDIERVREFLNEGETEERWEYEEATLRHNK